MFTLDSLFSSHAVLQRNVLIPVWGMGEPYSEIEVRLGDNVARTQVSTSGRWLLHMPAMAAGGPYCLIAKNLSGGEEIHRDDVVIGEVWLASGQSNMEFHLEHQKPFEGLKGDFRMFSVPLSLNYGAAHEIDACWVRSDAGDAIKPFSAVASYFAEGLTTELGVPVGIINSSFGGSDALSWVSRESLLCDPDYESAVRNYDEQVSRPNFSPLEDAPVNPNIVQYYNEHPLPAEAERGIREKWFAFDFDDSTWPIATLPAQWGTFASDENGAFWFRKRVQLKEEWRGRSLQLSIGAADKQDITYVNGVEVGRTGFGFIEVTWNMVRRYRIPAELTKSGILQIAVRVYSFFMDGGLIGKAQDMFLKLDDQVISLADEWKYCREFSCGRVRDIEPDKNRKLPFYMLPDNCPGIMFENMIRPLIPYTFRGVIWFQGEHNTDHRPEGYYHLMELLVHDWRWHFGMPNMPFHQVSLANFHAPHAFQASSSWATIRDIQHRIGEKIGSLAIPAYDVGDAVDIHFPDKRPLGRRLAQVILHSEYNHGVECLLNVSRIVRESASNLVIECRSTGNLSSTDGDSLFYVSDLEHEKFISCPFRLDGNRIILLLPAEVTRPRFVRYAWADNPRGAVVYNEAGFPLEPFERPIV